MVTFDYFRTLALSFPEVIEDRHFEKTAFRVHKKIFATYDNKNNRACIRLAKQDQDIFSVAAKGIIYPVPNRWGQKGWTLVELEKVAKELFEDALTTAYSELAPQKLSRIVRPSEIKRNMEI